MESMQNDIFSLSEQGVCLKKGYWVLSVNKEKWQVTLSQPVTSYAYCSYKTLHSRTKSAGQLSIATIPLTYTK